MSFARATRRPPLRPESPQARACRERPPSSLSPRRLRPRAHRISFAQSEPSTSHPAFSLRTCASSRALNSLSPSPSFQSISRASVQSATSARSSLAKLLEKCQAAQRQLDTELCALKGISCEVDARLAQQLRRRLNLLGTSPPCEEDRRSEMEGALRKLQEESSRCRMVKDHMESLIKTAAQVLTGQELFDQRPASVPAFAIQLQKQLNAKLQESRLRCRESATLGLESLRKTELRDVEDMAPFTLSLLVVNISRSDDLFAFGYETMKGEAIVFAHGGESYDQLISLYDVNRTGMQHEGHQMIQLNPKFRPLRSPPLEISDMGYVHDVCCGLGGFSTAFEYLGCTVLTAVDSCGLATAAYKLNHPCPVLLGDISSTEVRYQMHQIQNEKLCRPVVAAGFPCQPISRQGMQQGSRDARSLTLKEILKTAHLLCAAGVFLECVPEALTADHIQSQLHLFAKQHDMILFQRVLHLHNFWPSRRSRWFAVMIPSSFGSVSFPMLPCLSDPPTVGKLMPYAPWPVWSMQDEEQLRWTSMEEQVYNDPQFGSTTRVIQTTAPLPTALHSWGNALYPCPCLCRANGLSPQTLRAGGLRGVAVISGLWPHHTRHIHPRELHLFLGFPPFEKILDNCRAQLCLFGNSVSPMQVIWVWSHVMHKLGLLPEGVSSSTPLAHYIDLVLHQRDVSWPSPSVGLGSLILVRDGIEAELQFNTTNTVSQLLQAEASLSQPHTELHLRCEGKILPLSAFLQERTYEIVHGLSLTELGPIWIPVTLVFLGQVTACWATPSMSIAQFLAWVGIFQYEHLVDERHMPISPTSRVSPWQIVSVQQNSQDVAFELDMLEGFGFASENTCPGFLRTTESWICTGLWHLDELIRSQLLTTWSGLNFKALTVWLPSFAAAVLELWPSSIDQRIQTWLAPEEVHLHAFVYEQWGWSLVYFHFDVSSMSVKFHEPAGHHAVTARHLAYRVFHVSGRQLCEEHVQKIEHSVGSAGSLTHAMLCFHQDLALPSTLIADLIHRTDGNDAIEVDSITPTLPYEVTSSSACPFVPQVLQEGGQTHGLTAKFLLRFARSLLGNYPTTISSDQIQVLCVGHLSADLPACRLQTWMVGRAPLYLFVLVDRHWTLVTCRLSGDQLDVRQFDGLGLTSLSALAPLCMTLKQAWNAKSVSLCTSWKIEQTKPDTCGTIALGHFALETGLISFEQAMHFESLHSSLAVCSSLHGPCHLYGFGFDERQVSQDLTKILPGKGVPEAQVKDRVQAAIKIFGLEALGKAMQASNQWAALKQLGNNRPKPFMWVTNQELQEHIKDRAQRHYGADIDVKRRRNQKDKTKPFAAQQIDPASLLLPPDLFVTNQDETVPQIALDGVCKNAKGIAFAAPADVQQFLSDGKLISPDALNVLVIGALPDATPRGLPMHTLQVPAIYRGTNEPILLDCTSIQLGDQAVYRKQNQLAPEVAVFPTAVFRVHVFRDLWEADSQWSELVSRPVKSLVQAFDLLKLCRDPDCQGMCGLCHPSCEETGVESGLLDIWAFNWHTLDGTKSAPHKAEVLSVFFRVPESSFTGLHVLSGTSGVFFEPRHTDQPGPDPRYAVVWMAPCTLAEVMHRVKTVDEGLAACRLGSKYGIRCLSRDQEALHKILCPNKPFVRCDIKYIFRLEPLPAATQRQSLVEMLRAIHWTAKPLQPCKGSQGKAWTVGSETPPPQPFIKTQHGWVSVTKVKDQTLPVKPKDLIATVRTKQHMKEASSSSSAQPSQDPWQQGTDPWANYSWKGTAAPASQHVQRKLDDVEQKLTDRVQAAINEKVQQFQDDTKAGDRIASVEQQIQSIMTNQSKFENWLLDSSSKVAEIQSDQVDLHLSVQECQQQVQVQGQTLKQVAQEVAVCSKTLSSQGHTLQQVASEVQGIQRGLSDQLESYFNKQAATIEALMEKRQRHSNPSGISNKLHTLDSFPIGFWHLAETQASYQQQSAFQGYMRSLAWRSNRNLRCSLGAPAPYRAGSTVAGAWTGVLCFGDCPLRQVPCVWPADEYHSGRVLVTVGQVGDIQLTTATIYCPARGPTFPNARQLSEDLLTPVTENIVFGRTGPRAILGDFNCPAGQLQQMQLWQAQGWLEIQDYMSQKHGIAPRPTCKGATSPDQLWLSPEALTLVSNIAVWNIYPDHSMLIAGLHVPSTARFDFQWPLPGHIPWTFVDKTLWEEQSDIGPILAASSRRVGSHSLQDSQQGFESIDSDQATSAFRDWSRDFEVKVSQCTSAATASADRSYFGRGRFTRPRLRQQVLPVPKHSRQGEVEQICGFLNRASASWFKQLRRLQSYKHAANSTRVRDNYHSRAALWNSIRCAHGFKGGFAQWWPTRPHQHQGSPLDLPFHPPDAQVIQWIYDDFHHKYRCFEHFQWRRRQDSCKAKLLSTTKGLFAVTRHKAKYALDCLEDVCSQPVTVVDSVHGLVSVPHPFPSQDVIAWTLQSQPAVVKPVQHGYQVESDLLLVDGQQLACTVLVHKPCDIHSRLEQLWTPRFLPKGQIDLPALTVNEWKRAVHAFKLTAATGPCGWARADLVNLTDHHIQCILDMFSAIEQGAAWPQQLCIGLIHSLQKRADSSTANGFRPITVMSMLYRVYAGIRSGQILAQLAAWSDFMQCGFLRKRQAADLWYFVGVCIEVSFQTGSAVHGLVADLVKAYNTLPRAPTFEFLRILGLPDWFMRMWSVHLTSFTRHFLVRRVTGKAILSQTGFPEGCPLSCAAMTAVDLLWHTWQKVHTPRVLPMSYVDNFQLVCDRVYDLGVSASHLERFSQLLDLQVDSSCLYAWSTSSDSRRELKSQGYKVSLSNRDLGGQVTYCKQLRNQVMTDRMTAVHPLFDKLRKANLPLGVKKINIQQCLLPRALHACESVKIGLQHLDKLRSGVMRALHWNHAGASPVVRISLFEPSLDPEWYQLQHVVKMFRRQCRTNSTVLDWWKIFSVASAGEDTHGPFGKLQALIHEYGLQLDADCRLWFSEHGFVHVLLCSETVLDRVLQRHYHRKHATQISGRAGFSGLQDGCDVGLTLSNDHNFSVADVGRLMTARDGAFITDSAKSKFDTRRSPMCLWCNVPATREHKITCCSRYDSERAEHRALFRDWDQLPDCFRFQGLVPDNPWITLVWEALITLPSRLTEFRFEATGSTYHCFTDGTVSNPTSPEDALAAWSVVVADHGPLAWGPLPGLQQSVPRAEAYAILSALCWIEHFTGSVHFWIDNQGVVDHLRDIQRGVFDPTQVDHEDIWTDIQDMMRRSGADIKVHKVASHDSEENCESPLEDFARIWNDYADRQAFVANQSRPYYFQVLWQRYQEYRRLWKHRAAQMTCYQKAIADRDCVEAVEFEHDVEQDVSLIEFNWFPNPAHLASILEPWVDSEELFTREHDVHFKSVTTLFLRWLIEQDSLASHARTVSLIEMFVAFRLSRPDCRPVSAVGTDSRYSVVTFAADFSYFRKIVKHVFHQADISWGDTVVLLAVGIVAPQADVQCGPLPATAQLAASTAALQLVEKLRHKEKEPALQWPEPIPCFHGGLDDLQCRWPDDAVIKEEEDSWGVMAARTSSAYQTHPVQSLPAVFCFWTPKPSAADCPPRGNAAEGMPTWPPTEVQCHLMEISRPPGEVPPEHSNWLLRLGTPRGSRSGLLSCREQARHAILSWRLKRPYLIYSLACAALMLALLVWNIVKGIQNNWNLPQWKHHRWEEILEVTVGVAIVVEVLLTLRVLGVRDFCANPWCVFDAIVAVLTVVSTAYGLEHLGRQGEICEAQLPLLFLRFVLQPARLLAAVVQTWRTRRMQIDAEELRVDVNMLSNNGTRFEALQELS
eukprot:s956_g12.t2